MTTPGECDERDPHRLEATFHLMRRVLQDHTARWQARLPALTKPQYAALRVIEREPGVDQASVGSRAAIDKATLASLLLRLEQRGLITRVVDAEDRRRRRLALTDAGHAELRAVAPLKEAIDDAVLGALTRAERDQLWTLLDKLTSASEDTEP